MLSENMAAENHYFWMPEDPEAFLAALAAVQCLEDEVHQRGTHPKLRFYIPNHQCTLLSQCFPPNWEIESEKKLTGDYDLTVEFDTGLAYRLSLPTAKHISQMFGIMCGSEPKPLPDLSALKPEGEPTIDYLVLPWKRADELVELIKKNMPEAACVRIGDYEPWDACLLKVRNAKCVIGVRSEFTYIAAALWRKVIEIYPTDKHRNWLSKWTNKSYNMIYADPDRVDPTLVYSVLRQMK